MLKIIAPLAAASLSGIMMFAAFPSYDLSFLAWFGLVPLFLAFARIKPLFGVLLSFVFGVVFYTGLFCWMFDLPDYNVLHHAVLGLYLCPLLGIFAWLFCFAAIRWGLNAALFSAPFLWVALEFLRSNLSFLSLPWGLLAHSQYQQPVFIQIAAITGVHGISFVIVLVNAGITAALLPLLFRIKSNQTDFGAGFSQKSRTALITAAAVTFAATLVYGYAATATPIEGTGIRLSAVQANIEQSKKWDEKYAATIMDVYTDLTIQASEQHPSLIVWPEAATPKGMHRDSGIFNRIKKLALQTKTPILLGSSQLAKFRVTDPNKDAKYLNSAFLVDPTPGNSLPQRYDKVILLPFSEYLPYRETVPWSYLNIPDVDNFMPGKRLTIFELPPHRFGVLICWENIFADHVRQFVKSGAQFLINISNEAWFGETAAPYQFLSMNVFRAVENRRFLLRCANTGISCLIDPRGRIINKVHDKRGRDIFVRGILTDTLVPLKQKTFYNRYGDWFAWFCATYSLLFILLVLTYTAATGKPGSNSNRKAGPDGLRNGTGRKTPGQRDGIRITGLIAATARYFDSSAKKGCEAIV